MNAHLVDYLPSDLEREQIRRAIDETVPAVLEYWPREGSRPARELEIFTKPDGSKVTSADLYVHHRLQSTLTSLFPEDEFVSEEGDREFAPAPRRNWVLDPIDGTSHFIAGREDFGILLGLVVDGEPIASWIKFPVSGTLVEACYKRGVWWDGTALEAPQRRDFDPRRIHVRKIIPPPGLEHANTADSYAEVLAKLCHGEIDGAIFGEGGYPWDFAAPTLAFRESGLRVTDLSGKDLVFRARETRTPMVVSGSRILPDILRALKVPPG